MLITPQSAIDYVRQLPLDDPGRFSVVESWARCRAAGLDPDGPAAVRRVSASELRERRERHSTLLEAAEPLVLALHGSLGGTTTVSYITDAAGIVLWSVGDPLQLAQFSLSPGFDWSEASMGTNGAGTALVTSRPVVVAGVQHFKTAFQNCTCTAAPIRGPDRRTIGAVDVSSSVEEARVDRIRLVALLAAEIEMELVRREHGSSSSE
ncbi:MAG TPA: GAF domain-containing protein [Usitatibacter sp.]|nr:GAF domain-containing protein [Usitatibacter sp.]